MTTTLARWPSIGLAVQIVCSEVQPNMFGGASTLVRYSLFLVAALVPLGFLLVRSAVLLDVVQRRPVTWLLAYLAWVVVSAVWSVDPTRSMQPAIWTVSFAFYAIWYVSRVGWPSFRNVLAVTCAGFVLACALYESATGGIARLQGFSFGPTNLGLLAGIAVVAGWPQPRVRGRARIAGYSCVAVGLAGVVATSTRTVALALLVVAAYTVARRSGRSSALLIAVATIAVVTSFTLAASGGIVVVSQTPEGTDFVEERSGILVLNHSPGGEEYTTATGRTTVWSAALEQIVKRPVFGWGTGSSERVYNELAAQGRINWIAYGAHNVALSELLSRGAIGLGLALAAAWAYRGAARGTRDLTISALLLLLLVAGLSESLFDTGRTPTLVVAAAFAAVANNAVARSREARLRRASESREVAVQQLAGAR